MAPGIAFFAMARILQRSMARRPDRIPRIRRAAGR
jgi:hypothetical protein